MADRRSVANYALRRRATLASVYAGNTTVTDVCEAQPYLLPLLMCTETSSDSMRDGLSGVLS